MRRREREREREREARRALVGVLYCIVLHACIDGKGK
jgi:hypothetical protein